MCRRYVALFSAVGVAFHTTARVNAATFSAVGVGVMLPVLLLLVLSLRTTARVNAAPFSAVGVGVMLPIVYAAISRGRCRSYCCSTGTRPFYLAV